VPTPDRRLIFSSWKMEKNDMCAAFMVTQGMKCRSSRQAVKLKGEISDMRV
jgi:hypothetical protein